MKLIQQRDLQDVVLLGTGHNAPSHAKLARAPPSLYSSGGPRQIIMNETWIVPGAPLPDGAGWRIWYSRPGIADFTPQPPRVVRTGKPIAITTQWQLLAPLAGLPRRMGILTVKLPAPAPGQLFEITIPEARQAKPYQWMAMPNALDPQGVAFLFGSCFWRDNDKIGALPAAIRDICKRRPRPAFKLLCGDQLYQDWPANFSDGGALEICAGRYETYWNDPAYQDALRECPNYFLCDDHEYWNDYPEFQIHLQRTWTPESRAEYGGVCQRLYEYYQSGANGVSTPWIQLAIGPVSIFVSDSRSQRTLAADPDPHFFQAAQWTALEDWMQNLRGPGVFVIGQPLYQKDGDWKDHSLSNFQGDYRRLYDLISRSHQGRNREGKPHQILILSGDIHSGRYSVGRFKGATLTNEFAELHELIASASSKIGPYPQKVSIEEPPSDISAKAAGQQPIDLEVKRASATGDNNLGLVEMFPGTNGRVRFRLSVWRVRPHDARSWWDLARGEPEPSGPVIELFSREIQLQ